MGLVAVLSFGYVGKWPIHITDTNGASSIGIKSLGTFVTLWLGYTACDMCGGLYNKSKLNMPSMSIISNLFSTKIREEHDALVWHLKF